MKKLILSALIGMFAGAVSASELYWIGSSDLNGYTEAQYATLYAVKTVGGQNVGSTATKLTTINVSDLGWEFSSDVSAYDSSYSFFIELSTANDTSSRVAATGLVTYSTLSGSIYTGAMSSPNAYSSWSAYSAQVVPEPTSGLLLLLGLGALALKRKQRS